ncbi:phosphotransferase [Rhizobium sp. Leaf341]|uniref:phosphotransferase n=1 Tax=Rhizobium sp. Leaf341 TaxID=1736344 RepID=UPI0007127806|nr:phosphotransferase [Rhizobium sp. Leaf341]KQR71568.1 aminoglycoside phosphotransferase [Rhizobium sp. Leaf341]
MTKAGSAQIPVANRLEKALCAFADILGGAPSCIPAMAAVASPSYHAVESQSFLIVAKDGDTPFFLRLGLDEVADLVDGEAAFAAAVRFHQLGAAPQPLGYDAVSRTTLFTALGNDWKAANIDDLMQPETIMRLVGIQKEIAAGAPLGRSWSVFDGITHLCEIVTAGAMDLPGDAEWMLSWMAPIRQAIEASGIDVKPAHGDPHSSNVMLGPNGAIQLVDFDLAADIDPYYQLGVQMNELYQFESQMKPLLEMHDGTFSERAFNRCRAYAAADDLYWALRSLVLELRSPPRGIEFLKYAGWRFLRCRMLLGHPNFEAKLRDL